MIEAKLGVPCSIPLPDGVQDNIAMKFSNILLPLADGDVNVKSLYQEKVREAMQFVQ